MMQADLLNRRQALHYLNAHRPLTYPADEIFDDFEVYVGFQQSQANFAQGSIHICLAQLATAG